MTHDEIEAAVHRRIDEQVDMARPGLALAFWQGLASAIVLTVAGATCIWAGWQAGAWLVH